MNKSITESYRNNLTLAENCLSYRQHNGKHVVAIYRHCGEDVAPDVFRFDRIEEARGMWRKLRTELERCGYSKI